jgi:FkbM family methyltransferase
MFTGRDISMEVHRIGWPRVAAQKILPRLGPIFGSSPVQNVLSIIETSSAILQGKGAGTGWDELAEIRVALPRLKPGSVVFDIGANVGSWSRGVKEAFDGPLKLFLFEPQSSCHDDLADLVAAGAVLTPAAVGEQNGFIEFHTPHDKAGNASIYERKESYFDGQNTVTIKVPIISIDEFAATNSIERIDYMKIDVEGHELAVLKGADDLLSRKAIGAIAFEFGSANIYSGTFFRDFWDYLSAKGYSLSRITPGGRLSKVSRYYEDLEYFRGVSNYQAVLDPR